MLRQLPTIISGAVVGLVIRFLFRQFIVENMNFLLNPIIKIIWGHIFHPEKAVLTCPICTDKLYNLPN